MKSLFPGKIALAAFATIAAIFAIAGGWYFFIREDSFQFKIEDGNVVKVFDSGETEIVVDKNDYDDVENFLLVSESPDKEKICFVAQTLVPQWFYIADSDGSNSEKIDVAKNCVWSHDSEKIAYNNHTTDVSPVNVLMYDLETKEKTNFTQKVQKDDLYIQYQEPSWSDDDKYIYADYTGIDFTDQSNKPAGTGKITISTGWVEEM